MKKRSLHFLYFICVLAFSAASCSSKNKEETSTKQDKKITEKKEVKKSDNLK